MSEMNIDSFRNERMLFLKELASNPDRDAYELCDTLSIPKVKVMSFLRSYFKSVATFTDRDDTMTKSSYQDIRNDISLGVNTEFGELSDRDVDNLYYVYTKYRKIDPTLYLEADQVRSTKLYSEPIKQVAHDASNIPQPNLGNPNFPPQAEQPDPQSKGTDYYNRPPKPQTINDPNQAEFNVDRLNKGYSYDFLYGLTRIGLLRFVLEGLPYPPSGNKVEGFIQFFELNQDELMASPDSMRDRLQKYFGDKTGEQASVAFNSYIRYLKPGEKFGVPKLQGQLRDGYFLGDNPMYQRGPQQSNGTPFGSNIPMQFNEQSNMWGAGAVPQQQAGPKWQDPFNTFYHAELVLPYGMDARSTDAGRLIHEWEAKKKRKRDEDDVQNEIMRKINQRMAFSMGDVLDRGKQANGGGGGNSMFGPDFLQSMVAMSMLGMVTSGKASMIPFQGEDGKIQMKLEQQPQLDHTPIADPNAIGPRDILTILGDMYGKIADKQAEAMQARIDGLRDSMGINGERKDPLSMVGETIKGLREIIPGFDQQFSGGGQSNADMHRLLLERDKFMYDKERSDTLIDHQFEMKKMDKEHEQEAEIEANKTRQTTIKGITNALKSALPSIIQVVMMLVSMRNPALAPVAGMMGGGAGGGGGGLGDILGNVFKMFGGAGGDKGDDDDEDEDEEGDSSNPFSSLLGGGGGSKGDNDNDEDQGGFNLGDLVSQVMPSVMGMMQKQQRPPPSYPQADQPEIHSGRHHHVNRMREYDQGDGVRPTFMDVEVGNSSAATVKPMLDAGETPDNIYENIQTEQKVITTRPNINPELVTQTTTTTIEQEVIQQQEEEDPNVIKLPRYQDKLMNNPSKPEPGVVIPSPRQNTVNTYPDEEGDNGEEDDEEDPYPIYSAEDFDDLPTEQLRPAQNEGVASLRSSESYLNSINEQLKKRARKNR